MFSVDFNLFAHRKSLVPIFRLLTLLMRLFLARFYFARRLRFALYFAIHVCMFVLKARAHERGALKVQIA